MRFIKLQVLLLVVAVLAVGGVAADVILKSRAEDALAAQIVSRVPETTGVKAHIHSFPFVGRLLVGGQVSRVEVTAQSSNAGGIGLNDIVVVADDVEMDKGEATHGRAVVRSIKSGSVQADLRQDQITSRLPKQFQLLLQQGSAVVTGPGGAKAELVVTPEGILQIHTSGRTILELALPKTKLLPCNPKAAFVAGAVRLSCVFTEVPQLLLDKAQK